MDKRRVDHAVCLRRAGRQTVRIFNTAAMHVSPRVSQRLRRSIRTGQPQHLMTGTQ
ncbi:hypothetical protein D3C80_1996610 [compost metagenome]